MVLQKCASDQHNGADFYLKPLIRQCSSVHVSGVPPDVPLEWVTRRAGLHGWQKYGLFKEKKTERFSSLFLCKCHNSFPFSLAGPVFQSLSLWSQLHSSWVPPPSVREGSAVITVPQLSIHKMGTNDLSKVTQDVCGEQELEFRSPKF